LDAAYANNEISQAAYIEGLSNIRDGMFENLEALNELDKTMMEYYGETLAAGAEELAKYTDRMSHLTSVLSHYASVMDILGKQQDYKKMGVILEAQAKTIENEAKVAKENYNMLSAQAEARRLALEEAKKRNAGPEELELLEKQWWEAQAAADEA
jgi:SMC interacting uncharacterized protein involved in chromosome segregation